MHRYKKLILIDRLSGRVKNEMKISMVDEREREREWKRMEVKEKESKRRQTSKISESHRRNHNQTGQCL